MPIFALWPIVSTFFSRSIPIWLVLGLCLGAATCSYKATAFLDSRELAVYKSSADDYKARLAEQKGVLKEYVAGVERERANANLEALRQSDLNDAENARLREAIIGAQKERDKFSEDLTRMLNDAPMANKNVLSAAVLEYLSRVREHPEAGAAPTGNPN